MQSVDYLKLSSLKESVAYLVLYTFDRHLDRHLATAITPPASDGVTKANNTHNADITTPYVLVIRVSMAECFCEVSG